MPRKATILILLVAIALVAALSSSRTKNVEKQLLMQYAFTLRDDIEKLEKESVRYRYGKIADAEALKEAVRKTRNSYKKIEFILSYYYPDFSEGHLNGAPILHIRRDGARASIIPPEGLQVIDELVFLDADNEKVQIHQLAQKLKHSYDVVLKDLQNKSFEIGDVIPALRQEIVAILTLSLTGFDTPGSLNGIEESKQALFSTQSFLKSFFGSDADELVMSSQMAMAYLEKNRDFESFDRLYFLKEHLNPIYKEILNLAEKHGIENSDVYGPWNSSSDDIFAQDFLDPYFFTELTKEEDSPALRELGRSLFYDQNLSSTGNLSCGSCHQPELAFTDGKPRSDSNVNGETVLRNSPTLLNAAYADRYFYDLRAFSLEQQAEHVIFNSEEFNSAYVQIVDRLQSDQAYATKFKSAFGNDDVSREKLVKALSSYVLSLQSFNSRFDQYVRNEADNLTDQEKLGFNLFMGKAACGTCHFAPTFAGLVPPSFIHSESEILGVLQSPNSDSLDTDRGRNANHIINESAWIYERSFKTMTVRNVELTGPYFHNGQYETLEQVLNFYNKGGGEGVGLEVSNQTLAPDPLDLSEEEIKAIIAFMKSLTDNSIAELEYDSNSFKDRAQNSN